MNWNVKQLLNKQAGLDEDDFTESVTRFIEERERGLVGPQYSPPIADSLIRQIRQELVAGVRGGERLTDIQTRVRRLFAGPSTRVRAERIARTEVVGAMNRASNDAYNRSEVVGKKKWLTSRDDRVRPTKIGHFNHKAADGQIVDKDARFEVGGELLLHPGDPLGSAGNIIRCRCAIRPVLAPAGQPARGTPEFVAPEEERPKEVTPVVPKARNAAQIKSWLTGVFKNPNTKQTITPRTKLGKQVKSFFDKSLGVVDDAFEKIGLGRRWRNKVMIPDIMDTMENFDSIFPGPGAPTASFNPFNRPTGEPKNTLAFNFGIMGAKTRNPFDNASAVGHEGFHALQWKRGWYSRDRGSRGIMLNNKEAIRMKELWLKSVDRTKIELRRVEAVGQEAERRFGAGVIGLPGTEIDDLRERVKQGARARVTRASMAVTQEGFGSDFGNNYDAGFANEWLEIEEIKSFRTEAAGIRRGYGMHSPHEFGATSFESYLMQPDVLQRTNLETFNFFENYYKEGVFKRYVDYLRELEHAITRKNH